MELTQCTVYTNLPLRLEDLREAILASGPDVLRRRTATELLEHLDMAVEADENGG
jgi:hypothetical protein